MRKNTKNITVCLFADNGKQSGKQAVVSCLPPPPYKEVAAADWKTLPPEGAK